MAYTLELLNAFVANLLACAVKLLHSHNCGTSLTLKGKFSSGIEGALASTLNHDFN